MKSDDYVKYLTEQFVHYMNQPRDFRKQARAERKQYKRSVLQELFGLVPNAFSFSVGKMVHPLKRSRLPFLKSQKAQRKKTDL